MQKLTVYPTNIENFGYHAEDEIFNYLKLIDDIQTEETVKIPSEFYNDKLCEFIWSNSNPKQQTLIDYFTEVILKEKKTNKLYNEIFDSLAKPNPYDSEAITGMYCNKYIKEDNLYINNIDEIYFARVFYLSLITNFNDFESRARLIFSNLVFLDNSFKGISAMGNLHSTKKEIIRHLDILNRFAHLFFIETNRDAHQTMSKLNSLFGLNCTGVGGKQNSSEFRIKDTYKGVQVKPRCNAHTKLFDARNNYRIYFSWENMEIKIGKIIIGSVGGHIDA